MRNEYALSPIRDSAYNISAMLRLVRILPALLAAFLLFACQTTTPTASPTSTPTGDRPTPTPKVGGELLLLGSDPPTLDPHRSSDTTSASIIVEIFSGLVTLNRQLQVVPDLAERWELGETGTTYTFRVRQDARFHNGKSVTAYDFKWSLERATSPGLASSSALQYLNDIQGFQDKVSGSADELSGVRTLGERTLEITIDAPKSYFLSKLTHPVAFVLDRDNVEGNPNWTSAPNGTGPFKLKEYVPRRQMILERNATYTLGAPYLDRVKFLLSGGSPTLMYENDEIHVISIGTSVLERVADPSSPLHNQLRSFPGGFSVSYIGLKVTQPPLDDVNVRQALNYAVDRERIAHNIHRDAVVVARGVLPPGFPGYNPQLQGYTYDPDKARQLLGQSKYADGPLPDIVLTLPGDFGDPVPVDVEAVLRMWQETMGISVQVQATSFETFLDDLDRRRLHMFDVGWVADYPDPENFLDHLFHSESGGNYIGYSNPEVDRLLEQARVERDEATRFSLYQEAEALIVKDAPWVFMWHPGEGHMLVKPYVHDYVPAPIVMPILRYVHMSR